MGTLKNEILCWDNGQKLNFPGKAGLKDTTHGDNNRTDHFSLIELKG